jgi:large subunit ribosomal protein L4
MPSIELLNQNGKKVGNLDLADEIFAVEEHQQAVFDTIIAELAGRRQGTQKAKTRTEVSGGGKKPWRQKGTGRARQGSIRAPQWRGGGVVFAPTPRTYKMKVNKKVVKLAMKCALSEKIRENAFIAVDKIELDSFKTKGLVEVLLNLKAEGKVLVVTNEANGNLELAGRNLPYACVENVNHVSVYQMKNSSCVIITKDAIARYEEVLK